MSGVIHIRQMRKEDIGEVCEIEKEAFSVPWSENAFEESLKLPHAIFLVAEIDEILAGYCGLYKVFNEGDITNIAVRSSCRNRGVGKELLREMIERARQMEIKDITLEVRESNIGAIHLYDTMGFENVGIRKNFYEKPKENAIIMWKRDI